MFLKRVRLLFWFRVASWLESLSERGEDPPAQKRQQKLLSVGTRLVIDCAKPRHCIGLLGIGAVDVGCGVCGVMRG
jgi:hypothetical protein